MPQLIFVVAMAYSAYYVAAVAFVYMVADQRSKARKAERAAKDAYNASLKDRTVMTSTADGPRSRIYGRARNCDGILFKATRGANNEIYTLVVAVAGHEVDAIEDIYFNDQLVPLDGTGKVAAAPYAAFNARARRTIISLDAGGNGTFSTGGEPLLWADAASRETGTGFGGSTVGDGDYGLTVSWSGTTLTVSDGEAFGIAYVSYQTSVGSSKARVQKFLGGPGQDLSVVLAPLFPGMITSAHKFAGIACLIVDLEFDQDVFPSGVPTISAVVRGAKVLDPRTGVTAWSQNPALIARDWATYEQGGACSAGELYSVNAAANACDVTHAFVARRPDGSTVTTTRPMYQCGIVCRLDAPPDATMDEIVESMAGRWAWDGGKLRMMAGAYTAPVATLTESWCSGQGQIEIVSGPSRLNLVNVYKPTIADAALGYAVAPTAAVRAEAYITLDGQELPQDLEMGGVTNTDHAQHVCGVFLRDSRQGLTIKIPCNFAAYPVEVFDTLAVTLPRFGWENKPFLVLAWEFSQTGGVILTMKETAASVYDPDAEFSLVDAAPNTELPSLFDVELVTGLTLASGTTHLLKQTDGTLTTRIWASWSPVVSEAVRNGGTVEIKYGRLGTPDEELQRVEAEGTATGVYLQGVQDGAIYMVMARARNALVRGNWCTPVSHQVIGKLAAPGVPEGLTAEPFTDGVYITWDASTELDYKETVIRVGPEGETMVAWAVAEEIFRGKADSFMWRNEAPGHFEIQARHVDTSNHESVSARVEVDAADPLSVFGYRVEMTKQVGVLSATSAGVVADFSPASTTIQVLLSGVDDTENWAFTASASSGITFSQTDATFSVTAMSVDSGTITITGTKADVPNIVRGFTVIKVRAGAAGSPGDPGSPGAPGADGADGANGTRTGEARVYKWATSIPSGPTGTSTYTWATATFTPAPSGWAIDPPAPTAGFTLYAAVVRLSNTSTATTDTVNWTGASIQAVGAAGNAGQQGDSARIAYTVIASSSSLGTGTRTSSGSTSVPATNAWSGGETWQATPPSYGANQTVWQTNGIYVAGTNLVTWDTPYISALKVGSLSAISANLGTINAGDINGVTITGSLLQTAVSGQRIVLNEGGSNTARFYGNAGGGVELLAAIGPTSYGSTIAIGTFGTQTGGNGTMGLAAYSNSATALRASAVTGTGVHGDSGGGGGACGVLGQNSSSGIGVAGVSNYGPGVLGVSNSGGIGVQSDGTLIVNHTSGMVVQVTGATKGNVYFNSGAFKVEGVGLVPVVIATNGIEVARFHASGGVSAYGGIGVNGQSPQARYSVDGACSDEATAVSLLNQIRTALINCGICQ